MNFEKKEMSVIFSKMAESRRYQHADDDDHMEALNYVFILIFVHSDDDDDLKPFKYERSPNHLEHENSNYGIDKMELDREETPEQSIPETQFDLDTTANVTSIGNDAGSVFQSCIESESLLIPGMSDTMFVRNFRGINQNW